MFLGDCLNSVRLSVINYFFLELDISKTGFLAISALKEIFDSLGDPSVILNKKSSDDSYNEFISTLESYVDFKDIRNN